jgi:hypothetical protein
VIERVIGVTVFEDTGVVGLFVGIDGEFPVE